MRFALALLLAAHAIAQTPELRIIDAHVHAESPSANRDDLFREWKEAGVIGGVSMLARTDQGPVAHDPRLVHCAGIPSEPDVARLEKGLKAGEYQCLKIYLGYVHQYASDPRYKPVYALAERFDVPVVFHTGDTDSTKAKLKYADPLTVDEVAVDHPKVRFVIAHAGNPWIESAAEVAYKNPNVYLDLSAFLTGDLRERDRALVDEYVTKPIRWIYGYVEDPKKLMFATDWPVAHIGGYVDAVKRAIPPESWPAVFHDNAVRVFKLQGRFAQ